MIQKEGVHQHALFLYHVISGKKNLFGKSNDQYHYKQ